MMMNLYMCWYEYSIRYGALAERSRPLGRFRLGYKGICKHDMKLSDIEKAMQVIAPNGEQINRSKRRCESGREKVCGVKDQP